MHQVSRSIRFLTATTFALAAAPLALAQTANPDLRVTKFTDSFDGQCNSDCSLREAIQRANEVAGPTRIILRAGTYRLSLLPEREETGVLVEEDANANGDLDIRGNVTLVGTGMTSTVINANHIDRVIHVHAGASVQMSDLVLFQGFHTDHGGGLAIEAGATVLLRRCNVSNSLAGGLYDAAGHAGGISNLGTLTLEGSLIEFNQIDHGDNAGLPSRGGGVYNTGTLTVRETRFTGNRARDRDEGGFGGALYNGGNATILRSLFDGNGVSWAGSGSAILNGPGATLRMENTTVAEGDPEDFFAIGAVANGSAIDLVPAVMRLINVTIADNQSHGILNHGKLEIFNSIVAGNGNSFNEPRPETNCLNVGPKATLTQRGLMRGLDDFTNCAADYVVPKEDVFRKVLYPLALNNWVLPTFALKQRSPAVDAAVGGCPSTDARRSTRPRDGDGDGIAKCDLGAYERPKP